MGSIPKAAAPLAIIIADRRMLKKLNTINNCLVVVIIVLNLLAERQSDGNPTSESQR